VQVDLILFSNLVQLEKHVRDKRGRITSDARSLFDKESGLLKNCSLDERKKALESYKSVKTLHQFVRRVS
jgi:hypothetical protein